MSTSASDSDKILIWGASLGRIKTIGCRCEWDADVDIENLSSVQPFAKELLEWLFRNEKFCRDHCKDEKTALHVHDQVLVGETSEERRVNEMGPEEECEALGISISEPNKHSKSVEKSEDAATPEQLGSTGTLRKSKERKTADLD